MRLRFAPSPTGLLHVGNARTALFNWLLARHHGGVFILRIEDTDAERSTRESEKSLIDDMRWLGLGWDEGPDAGGAYHPYRQSERLDIYKGYADTLVAGEAAYYCFCTPQELEADRARALAERRAPQYSGRCRALSPARARQRLDAGESAAIRFKAPSAGEVAFDDLVRGRVTFDAEVLGDFVILRSDGWPAYNFAVVVDDALMRVTHVIRGEDHVSNTPRQVLVYEALGFTPPRFAHLSMIVGPDHARLSKRHGATSVSEFRARGYLPEALVNYLALLGWSPGEHDEVLPLGEMARRFAIEDVTRSAAIFDLEKLAWMNRRYLQTGDVRRVASLTEGYFVARGWIHADNDNDGDGAAWFRDIVSMCLASVNTLEEIAARASFVFEFDPAVAAAEPEVHEILAAAGARDVIRGLAAELAGAPRLTRELFREAVTRVKQQTGLKGKSLFHPVRAALTGRAGGPELDVAVPLIDRGAELSGREGVAQVIGCRERAAMFASIL